MWRRRRQQQIPLPWGGGRVSGKASKKQQAGLGITVDGVFYAYDSQGRCTCPVCT
ncbi:hypothetical protein HK100_007285 [Physocladia obscura]|uniref:Uncharacterized protein n=1 Tax=Physocladia obscura TaxID=109957 RepID=A0AAD5SPQ7_9FUNG|nr:hypothetical protein HK100_007285 [Physocladia obscura]